MDTLGDDYILIPQDFGMIRNYSHKNEIHPKIVIIKRKINKDLQTLK